MTYKQYCNIIEILNARFAKFRDHMVLTPSEYNHFRAKGRWELRIRNSGISIPHTKRLFNVKMYGRER